MRIYIIILLLIALGCRGMPSKKPPIHLNPNMDNTERFDPQEENKFFKNNMSMRMPINGTIAKGYLKEDDAYYRGKKSNGDYLEKIPNQIEVNFDFIKRGQQRFNIYCSACHGMIGDGNGLVAQSDMYPLIPTSMYTDYLYDKEDGYLFDVITNGVRNMPSYSYQINEIDRWAIVSYVRALQMSRTSDTPIITSKIIEDIK